MRPNWKNLSIIVSWVFAWPALAYLTLSYVEDCTLEIILAIILLKLLIDGTSFIARKYPL